MTTDTASLTLRKIEDLPGPRGLPLLGNMLQIRREHIHQNVEQWVREYGPFLRFQLGGMKVLAVADHEAFAAVLKDRPDGFRRLQRLQDILCEMGLAPGVFSSNGEAWRRQRRMVMASFDPGHVRAYFPSLLKVTQRLHGRWQMAARTGAAIDLQADLMRFTVDAIAGLAFGTDINTLESDDEVIQRHLDKIFPALFKRILSLLPTWRVLRLPSDRQLERSVAEVNAAIQGFIAQARERMRADPARRDHPSNLLEA
ncbi:MAG: cytochrome P450, partial [Betaproteobacteria bacterium]